MSGYCHLVRFINDSNWAVYNAWDNKPDVLAYYMAGVLTIESDSSIWIGGDGYLTRFDGIDQWTYYTFAHGYDDNATGPITIDEYGNKISLRVYQDIKRNPDFDFKK